jgi:hypothetical protein
MTDDSATEVTIRSIEDGLMEIEFPPNMRLHSAEFGQSWSVQRRGNQFRSFSNASTELAKIFEELQKCIRVIKSVAGDFTTVKIRHNKGQSALIAVLLAAYNAIRSKGLPVRYENLCLIPSRVQPRYAV